MITRKEDRPCCAATRDTIGRYCLGFYGPDCIGRVERDAILAAQGTDPKHHGPYSETFRTIALDYANERGVSAAAATFGICTSTIYEWRSMAS